VAHRFGGNIVINLVDLDSFSLIKIVRAFKIFPFGRLSAELKSPASKVKKVREILLIT
jgi:hypothetical protein